MTKHECTGTAPVCLDRAFISPMSETAPLHVQHHCVRTGGSRQHVYQLRQAICSSDTQFGLVSVCNYTTARSSPPAGARCRCEATEIELHRAQTLREPPLAQLWPTRRYRGTVVADMQARHTRPRLLRWGSGRSTDFLLMLPHRCLLARAAFGALSSSLVYAAHHRPRKVTLTRLSLAER